MRTISIRDIKQLTLFNNIKGSVSESINLSKKTQGLCIIIINCNDKI